MLALLIFIVLVGAPFAWFIIIFEDGFDQNDHLPFC